MSTIASNRKILLQLLREEYLPYQKHLSGHRAVQGFELAFIRATIEKKAFHMKRCLAVALLRKPERLVWQRRKLNEAACFLGESLKDYDVDGYTVIAFLTRGYANLKCALWLHCVIPVRCLEIPRGMSFGL
jgi:hypothetical protein